MSPSRVRIPPSPFRRTRRTRLGTMTRSRRGGRAVECGGLENRFGLLGPTRVQIPPPPLNQAESRSPGGIAGLAEADRRSRARPFKTHQIPLIHQATGARLARTKRADWQCSHACGAAPLATRTLD